MKKIDVLVLGGGTAGSNSARAAIAAGSKTVMMVHLPHLINTCIEEGCMPSKSILAGAHKEEPLTDILTTRDAHITRLKKVLTDSFDQAAFTEVAATAHFIDDVTVMLVDEAGEETKVIAKSIIIASGSKPFTPPIPGLDTLGDKLMISDHVVSSRHHLVEVPRRVLTIGAGPIGLELSTFFHDLGSKVTVLQRKTALTPFDPEFGQERVRASFDEKSFPILEHSQLLATDVVEDEVICTISKNGAEEEMIVDAVLVATGRTPNLDGLKIENTTLKQDERNQIIHEATMQTSVPHIYVAGDVTGHNQILHFAAEMGKVAGHNAAMGTLEKSIDYDRHMLAVSFDQFPSALIGLTETEALKRDVDVVSVTKEFKSIGLGILKRQEYGIWKIVAEKTTGRIIGSQIVGPESAGELIQLLVPILANQNTAADIINMTWYHPTYAEILLSLARDIETKRAVQ